MLFPGTQQAEGSSTKSLWSVVVDTEHSTQDSRFIRPTTVFLVAKMKRHQKVGSLESGRYIKPINDQGTRTLKSTFQHKTHVSMTVL